MGDGAKQQRRRNLRATKRTRDSSDEEDGRAVGAREARQQDVAKKAGMTFTTKSSKDPEKKGFHTFESSGLEARAAKDDATRTLDEGPDSRSGVEAREGDADPNTYRGMQGYTDYRDGFRREDARGGGKQAGPARPSANYRMSVLVDYQPDVCKDYKETGFCGFGDSCKFLHDRSVR